MARLTVFDCLCRNVSRVLEEDRPEQETSPSLYAVFRESVETGIFCGLATPEDINKHPS